MGVIFYSGHECCAALQMHQIGVIAHQGLKDRKEALLLQSIQLHYHNQDQIFHNEDNRENTPTKRDVISSQV